MQYYLSLLEIDTDAYEALGLVEITKSEYNILAKLPAWAVRDYSKDAVPFGIVYLDI